ncbi:hypothetical protein AMATHDRAFT_62641 [Amanita thiersii Skay4041]|uniref:Plant basic secretory protein n=1 Tax=Amanita thiersii Skay4041 TaxID=703135 RepID=A0A2A9NPR5_9AGAR|nr:hypothetical protein AMATHDRAFT_62641 [Amanita thiersii Skay4041]
MAPLSQLQEYPRLSVRIENLDHKGVDVFFNAVGANPYRLLIRSIDSVIQNLYGSHSAPPNNVSSILLCLRPMEGVACTSWSGGFKEICFSLDYITSIPPDLVAPEIEGVLVHEFVHCFQYNACGTCPGGLIEGIADFVRLRANLAPPHWSMNRSGDWDAGYERTGYFLEWIERQRTEFNGEGFVEKFNLALKDNTYNATVFEQLTGMSVLELWKRYCEE